MFDPQISGPRILKILDTFGSASRLRVNRMKLVLVPLRGDRDDEAWAEGFSVRRLSFKYLGMMISTEPSLVWSLNISPLLKYTKKSLKAWENLPLNTMGRVAIIKMMLLPKFLYITQNYPGGLPAGWFRTTNALLQSFIWGNKPPRVSFAKCCQSTYDGGLAMIDLQLYYWASQLVVIHDWMCGGWSDPTYRRELLPLGLEGVLGMLYGGPVSPGTLEGLRAVVMAWR